MKIVLEDTACQIITAKEYGINTDKSLDMRDQLQIRCVTYPCILAIRDHARKAGPPKKSSRSDLLMLYLFKI